MSFNWKKYYKLAEHIKDGITGVDKEACQRSAVSRAYYAAFCKARNYARDREGCQLTRTGEDHGLVQKHHRVRQKRHVAVWLGQLYGWRNQCDYDDVVPDLELLCRNAFRNAQKILAIFP